MADKTFHISLECKEPDEFGELVYALGDASKAYFKFGEYASINLEVVIEDGKPVIKKAEFAKL